MSGNYIRDPLPLSLHSGARRIAAELYRRGITIALQYALLVKTKLMGSVSYTGEVISSDEP
jgi:hypothetical protein